MRRFWHDVSDYLLHFAALYLLSCLVLGPLFMLLALLFMVVLEVGFGVDTGGDEQNLFGGIGIGLSMAFVVAWPLALVGTWWAAPNDRNVQRDLASLSRKTGSRPGEPRGQPPV